MEFCTVSFEAHSHSATIYVMGLLSDPAAVQTGTLIDLLPSTTRSVRLDLRGVEFIHPTAFVSIARALNRWRDQFRGRVTIEFPARSRQRAPHLHLVRQSPVQTGIFDERAARSAAY
jgi:hypothetical protein